MRSAREAETVQAAHAPAGTAAPDLPQQRAVADGPAARTEQAPGELRIGGLRAGPGRPVVMAVINRSVDSFFESAGNTDAAVRAACRAHEEGAAIVDIGGVRAGRGPHVSTDEEIERICPVIEAVHAELPELVISADTYRAPAARAALAAGARILNDTWAGTDPELPEVAAAAGAGIVCSHTGGLEPRTDAHRSRYGLLPEDVVADALGGVEALARAARAAGVPQERIILDPTPDFGKNSLHSLALLRRIRSFTDLGMPVMLAISRKDFIGEAVGADTPADRLPATLAATAYAVEHGASIIRAHDTAATLQVVDMIGAITGTTGPRRSVRGLR
ncbi:dihydropteroate synthase [Brevibacterium album]|uniref:dihydropteroate synthase n=1 Tax=Brevibacterium album TaxID=417948 RepID=UPI0003FA7179|nr:dihydropteroate synthase [Brevibacterium album]